MEQTWLPNVEAQLIENRSRPPPKFSKKEVKGVMEALVDVGHKELKKNGVFLVPAFAKFVVVKKPAPRLARAPTRYGEEMMFMANRPGRSFGKAGQAAKDGLKRKGLR